jgi:hypothetical protein
VTSPSCPAGHELAVRGPRRVCGRCRREAVIAAVAAAEESLPVEQVTAAVDVVAGSPQGLRSLAAALAADPAALAHGAPPMVGRLVTALVIRGSTTLTVPACVDCGQTGRPLTATGDGGRCGRCAHRRGATACSACGAVKPVAGRTAAGEPICERCRRHQRGHRRCGICGKTASIAVRGRDGEPDICVNCYRMPRVVCSVCGREGECNYARTDRPICPSCSPRNTAKCAHCGQDRPPVARWPEGPVCDTCYTTALRRRGTCTTCRQERRLVDPPGPAAATCADCAGLVATHICAGCGIEDKLFEKGRCARCSLRGRARSLLQPGAGDLATGLRPVVDAIAAARNPYTALNWLRTGAAAAILSDLAAGQLAVTHHSLDSHPDQRAADYLRHMLVAVGILPERDEALARLERWSRDILDGIDHPADRRLAQAYLTWQILRRLRRRSETNTGPRTYTAHARHRLRTVADFLAWLRERDLTLHRCRQADMDQWLADRPHAYDVRDFLIWAAEHRHCPDLHVPRPTRRTGTATSPDQRWEHIARLLHDNTLELTDRAAGCLLLLFGQHLSRIAVMTTDQVAGRDRAVFLRLGRHEVPVPDPLGDILTQLIDSGRTHVGIGSPATTRWLFPGGMPGRPITAARLGERLRALGIRPLPGRRAALIDLAAQLPAAVVADLLHLSPGTAVRWMKQAGGDWTRYAAEIARSRNHQP